MPPQFSANPGQKNYVVPGCHGRFGIGVSGNRLYLYSNNQYADVPFGWDNAGTFNERFSVKPNGPLAVVGNTGNPGQVLVSNGAGAAASWSAAPGAYLYGAISTAPTGFMNSTNPE